MTSPAASPLAIQILTDFSEFASLRKEWNNLLQRCSHRNVFMSHQWLFLWWQVFASKRLSLLVILVRIDGALVGAAPFYVENRSAWNNQNTLRFIGTGEPEADEVVSECMDIMVEEGREAVVQNAISTALADNLGGNYVLDFRNILVSSSILELLSEFEERKYFLVSRSAGWQYSIVLDGEWSDYLAQRPARVRTKLRQLIRKREECTDLEFKVVQTDAGRRETMDALAELHCELWKSRGEPGAFSSQRFRQFHDEFSQIMLKVGSLRLSQLVFKGEIVGVLYNFIFQGVNYYYQSGFKTEFLSKLRLGYLMHLEEIQWSLAHKLSVYDFLRGSQHSYKRELSTRGEELTHVRAYPGIGSALLERAKSVISRIMG